jgi:hypothetical protein
MYNLSQDELKVLKACQTASDWEAACDAVKAARGGQYPPDWWPVMKLSGLMDKIFARWGSDSNMRLTVMTPDGKWKEIN